MTKRTTVANEERQTRGASEARDEIELLKELEKAMLIDKDGLDDCLIAQPDLFYRVSKQLVHLVSKRDAAKHYLEVTEAEVDETIRAHARDTERKRADKGEKEKKVTEGEIRAQISMHEDVVTAHQSLADLTRRAAAWLALKEAYQQRSYVLKDLTALHIANYYTDAPARNASGRQYDDTRRAMNEERQKQSRQRRDRD